MVRLLKLAVALLATGVLVGCLATELGDNSGGTASSGEVKFCLESLGGAGVSASVSGEATETTPASVALEYSTADGKETVSKTIELTPFGSGYITKKVISLDEGAYELTRFDVLDETGNTIYSTPTAGSDIATEVGIGTALSYRFTVAEGEINEIKMQVITVDDDTDPADFGHAAFTFEVVGYNRLYIDVLALIDSVGWEYVPAELSIADESGAVVKETDLNAVMNKVILPNSESYTLTISKAGYASQVFTLEQADFAQYKLKPLVVQLGKTENISTDSLLTKEELVQMIAEGKDVTQVNTSGITDMSHLMDSVASYLGYSYAGDCSVVENFNQDISGWDVSNVTNMEWMFYCAEAFNQDIGGWDVSSVTDMEGMFYCAYAFNQDIGGWDVSNITNMEGMFVNVSAFNQDIGDWVVSSVTDMGDMFYGADAFNQDIGDWDVSSVKMMPYMFENAKAFDQDIGEWDVSSVTNMEGMFREAHAFNQDIGEWDVSSVTYMGDMFCVADAFNQDISGWDVSNVGYYGAFDNGTSSSWTDDEKPKFK